MNHFFWCLRCSLVLLILAGSVAAQSVAVPALRAPVTDLTGTLTPVQIQALSNTLLDLQTRKGSQVAVLMVPTTQPETIEQFSIRVVEAWRLGRKEVDDGALLLVAKQDRSVRIEVGYGLEGVLSDAVTNRIIRQWLLPAFRNGDYYQGLSAATARMIALIDGEALPEPATHAVREGSDLPWFLMIFAVIVGGSVLRAAVGRLAAAGISAGVIAVIAWIFVGSLLLCVLAAICAFIFVLGGGGGGGWSNRGGWSSGYGGGFGGGSSGYGGGGGGFGGGGASGRW